MEVSVREIVESYLRHNHLKVIAGEYGAGDVLYPFLLMDLVYGIYQGEIRKVECKRELKRARGKWNEAYGLFTRSFFAAFSVEQQDEICDLMDEYEKWMGNSLMVVRVAVMDAIGDRVGVKEQRVLSACQMCNILAQCAQIVFGTIFKDEMRRARKSREIEEVRIAARQFSDEYAKECGLKDVYIDLNKDKKVNAAVDAMLKKLTAFPRLARCLQGECEK